MDRRRFLIAGPLLTLTGCLWNKQTTSRSQRADPEDEVLTIGDVSVFDNAAGIPVSGVGLVIGLDGTGGSPPPGDGFRTMLEDDLRHKGRDDVKKLLESRDHALVLISGVIPAGARKNDPVDLEITLPAGTKAKSLRGGYLLQCNLYNYDTRSNVRSYLSQTSDITPTGTGDGLLKGHPLLSAEGPLHTPIRPPERTEPEGAEPEEPTSVRRAWIWSGGVCRTDRPFYLELNGDHQRYRVATQTAERINETFRAPGAGDKLAEAKTKELIILGVPPQYRLNMPHYLRVVRSITLERQPERGDYVRKLEELLQEPATAIPAALRLEALGAAGVPILAAARESSYPLVRFAAAEALAYLDDPAGAEELSRLAVEHPALQAYCLTALAALGEGASFAKLHDLLGNDKPEVRYGAFRALRVLDPRSEGARGESVPQPETDEDGQVHKPLHWFHLHEVAPDAAPLVHVLSGRRAEVALFGKTPALMPGCSLTAGEFTVTMRRSDTNCTVSRFSPAHGPRTEQCSSAVAEVVRTLARMGATYAEVVQVLRQADRTKSLNCPFAVDAMPRALTVKQLAEQGKADPTMQREAEIFQSSEDLGTTPTLYELNPAAEKVAKR